MRLAFSVAAVLLAVPAWAKPLSEDDPEHAYHYRTQPAQAGDVTATAPVAWARQGELKLKVALENATNDYVLLRKDGVEVTTGGESFSPERTPDKFEMVAPHGQGAHLFVITDDGNRLHHPEMQVAITAAWTADPSGNPLTAADTTVPPKSNTFEAGPFRCQVKGNIKRKTDQMTAKYSCTYNGTPGHVGFVTENAVQVGLADGTTFANEATGDRKLLLPGDSITVAVQNSQIQPGTHHVDMQYDEVIVHWAGVFREVGLQPLDFGTWAFTLDEALTAEKND